MDKGENRGERRCPGPCRASTIINAGHVDVNMLGSIAVPVAVDKTENK